MINLLSPEQKEQIVYARRNGRLIRVLAGFMSATVFALLIVGAGRWYMAQTTERYKQQIAEAESSLSSQNLGETKQKIQDLSNSMNLVIKVLSQEVLFSKLLRQAGTVMPPGSALSTIEINGTEGGIDIIAGVDNYQVGTQVQINLQDPQNKLFEKVDLVSVSCGEKSSDEQYPCQANIRALFGDNSPYLFINRSNEGSSQ